MGRYTPGASLAPEHTPAQGQQWVEQELRSISAEMREGAELVTHYQPLGVLPARPREGDVGYFRAGVAGVLSGLYLFGASGIWEAIDTSIGGSVELYGTTGHGAILPTPGSNVLPTFIPLFPGQVARLFSLSGGGVFTALEDFSCDITVGLETNVNITANNGDISWQLQWTETAAGADSLIRYVDFAQSSRIVAYTVSGAMDGNIVLAAGDTLNLVAEELAAVTANCAIPQLFLSFHDVVPLA